MEFAFDCKSCNKIFVHYKEFKNHGCQQLKINGEWNTMMSLKEEIVWNPELKALMSNKVQNVIITQKEKTQSLAITKVVKEDKPTKVSSENRLSQNEYPKPEHSLTCMKIPINACKMCQKEFLDQNTLEVHIKIHSFNRNYYFPCKVPGCNSTFAEKKLFWEHVHEKHKSEVKKRINCYTCKKSFSSALRFSLLEKHLLRPCAKTTLVCSQCGKKFTSAEGLKMHMKRHKENYDVKCGECNKKFLSKGALKSHTDLHHNTGNIYSCEECEATFKLNYCFKIHIRTHTGEKYFKCREGCEDRFRIYSTRDHHERKHGVKKYLCSLCPKKFMHPTQMYVHIKRHKGIKNYICQVCGKTFVEPAGAKKCKHSRI